MCYCLMTFIWVSQSDGSSSGNRVCSTSQRSSRSSRETADLKKIPRSSETRGESHVSNLNTASWYIRQWRGCLHTFVQVCDPLKCLSTFTVWSSERCVYWGTHTARKERNIKLQSTRGITELSVWQSSCIYVCKWVTVFLIFVNAVCFRVCT